MDQPSGESPWLIDASITFLNHGSYGACPRPVLDAQSEWRERMERQPLAFLGSELERHLDRVRQQLAGVLGTLPSDLAFVPNATTGINAVLRSLPISRGDELLTTDHEYNACHNALYETASAGGATVVEAPVPFPIRDPQEVLEAMLGAVTPRTRLALISHVTSATALVFPIHRLVAELAERGVETLVDGAHAPGMVPVELDRLGAAYYAGNCHKWLCAPKGSGFLYVRRDRQAAIRPLVISHGANSARADRSRFLLEFDWTGTGDPTAYLATGAALDFLASMHPGGLPALMKANHRLLLDGREIILAALGREPPAPAGMVGAMAAIPLSDELAPRPAPPARGLPPRSQLAADPLHDLLLEQHDIEVPVYPWPPTNRRAGPLRLLRISAQAYNRPADYERLAEALRAISGQGNGAYASRP